MRKETKSQQKIDYLDQEKGTCEERPRVLLRYIIIETVEPTEE